MNFNHLPCDIKTLIFKHNRISNMREKQIQQTNKNRLIDHLNMINQISINNDFDMIDVLMNNDLFDLLERDYCNEYLLEDELDALQQEQFNKYYNLE